MVDIVDGGGKQAAPFVYPTSADIVQDGVFSPVVGNTPVNMIAARTTRRDQDPNDLAATAGLERLPTPIVQNDLDLRAKLFPKTATIADLIYGNENSIARAMLYESGFVWPTTPTIAYAQDVSYTPMDLTHTNQEMLAYNRTPAVKLTVAGTWTSQTQGEAAYTLACIHFLRNVTKMSFGKSKNPEPGTPPPVLLFSAHGGYMFKNLPVLITNFSMNFDKEPDYIPFTTKSGATRVPATLDITVQLTVQHTPRQLRNWSIDDFRNGKYIKSGGWI